MQTICNLAKYSRWMARSVKLFPGASRELASDIAERFRQYGTHPRCQACLRRGGCKEIQAGTAGDMFYCSHFIGYFAEGIDKANESMVK